MDVNVGGCLGYRDQDMLQFGLLRGANRAESKNAAWNFRKAEFNLFSDLIGIISHGNIPEEKEWLKTAG